MGANGPKPQEETMEKILRQLSLFLALMYLHSRTGNAELIISPRDTEVLVNHSTYFNCSTSIRNEQIHWYHYRVGENRTNIVYYKGEFNKNYPNRYNVTINIETGEYNLLIHSVQSGDAGRYVCQDDGGRGGRISAELIVLDANPICASNIKPEGLVGPNRCDLPIEELHLSCSVSYSGNIPPILQWKTDGEDSSISKGIAIDNNGKSVTMNLTMSSDVELDGVLFTCGTTRSHHKQHSCTTDRLKINYAFDEPLILDKARGEIITCSTNASVPCTYRWFFYGNDTLYPASCTEVLATTRLENYSCEASCPMSGFNCTFIVMRIFVVEEAISTASEDTTKTLLLVATIVGLFLLVTTCVLFVIILKAKIANNKLKSQNSEQSSGNQGQEQSPRAVEKSETCQNPTSISTPLLSNQSGESNSDRTSTIKVLEKEVNDLQQLIQQRNKTIEGGNQTIADLELNDALNKAKIEELEQQLYPKETIDYADKPELLHKIPLPERLRGKSINGITILSNELFIVIESSQEIEVYNSKTFQHQRNFKVSQITDPLDITSFKDAKCLFIVGVLGKETKSKIVRIDLQGKILKQWSTDGEKGRLSTYGSNVILCLKDKQSINEYSPEGDLIVTVRLSKAVRLCEPLHAIKVTSTCFVVSHSDFKGRELHRVCVVDLDGQIKKECAKMKVPICLVEDNERSIIVADRYNNEILLLSSMLKYQRTLIGKEHIEVLKGSPVRLCFDDIQSKLFIAVNSWDSSKKEWRDGHILIFNIKK